MSTRFQLTEDILPDVVFLNTLQHDPSLVRAHSSQSINIPPHYLNQPPTVNEMRNEYWPKCGNAAWLKSKARLARSICGCMCELQVKLYDTRQT